MPIKNTEVLKAKMAERDIEVPFVEMAGNFDHPAAFVPATAAALGKMAEMNREIPASE